MPDTREHRGPHPADAELFAPGQLDRLRAAVADFSMLLTKGYADKSALTLVGDRFSLTQRQRLAVMRNACSDQQLHSRLERRVPVGDLVGQPIAIDGYNLLITIEAAMSGGLIFKGRDGCFRDLASIHGTYRKVEETIPAINLIGQFLMQIRTAEVRVEGILPSDRGRDALDTAIPQALWLLDSPVSNSGRLKTLFGQRALEHNWPWEIRLTISPDAELRKTDEIVVSTDSAVLDACQRWTNLAAEIITRELPQTVVLDIAASPP